MREPVSWVQITKEGHCKGWTQNYTFQKLEEFPHKSKSFFPNQTTALNMAYLAYFSKCWHVTATY